MVALPRLSRPTLQVTERLGHIGDLLKKGHKVWEVVTGRLAGSASLLRFALSLPNGTDVVSWVIQRSLRVTVIRVVGE